jgi:hypothetical protein
VTRHLLEPYAVGAQHTAPLRENRFEVVQQLVGQLVNCAAACCTNSGLSIFVSKLVNSSLTNWPIVQQLVALLPWGRNIGILDVKTRKFREQYARAVTSEDAGKLSFYLAAVDGELSTEGDNPTIGLLLCKTKNAVTAEYALRNINAPLGVPEYQLTESLPKDLETALPSIEELEAQLEGNLGERK